LFAKWLLPKADGIRVVSERIKKSLSSIVRDMSKVIVLPIFVDVAAIKNVAVSVDLHQKYPQFDFIILMASRLEKEKNCSLAIDAFAQLTKKIPNAGLVIIGDGSEQKKLEREALRYKIQDQVDFMGWKDNVAGYYKSADVLLEHAVFVTDTEAIGRQFQSSHGIQKTGCQPSQAPIP